MPLTISSDDRSVEWDFCLIFAPLRATMSQKSSLPQAANSVSRVLMTDSVNEIGVLPSETATGGVGFDGAELAAGRSRVPIGNAMEMLRRNFRAAPTVKMGHTRKSVS